MNWLTKIIDSMNFKESSVKLLIYWSGPDSMETMSGSKSKNKEILVGSLEKTKEFYVFQYDENCPDKYKIKYLEGNTRFRHLPPFFTTRIPSLKRPDLAEEFKKYPKDDLLRILGEMGSKTPISPYVFKIDTAA